MEAQPPASLDATAHLALLTRPRTAAAIAMPMMHARWRMSQRYAQPSPFFWLWLWLAVPLLFLRDPVAGLCTPQSRIPRTRPSNIPGPWQPMSPQQSRMTTLRKAEQMIYPRVRIPTPEELRSGRPMGREQLGLLGFYWLQREMRWLAQDYLLMAEEESLGYISVSEERHLLLKLRAHFAVPQLQAHLERRLVEAPPREDAVPAAAAASRHEPTTWGAFQQAIQARLIARAESSGADWRKDLEWVLLKQVRLQKLLKLGVESAAATTRAKERAKQARQLQSVTTEHTVQRQRPKVLSKRSSGLEADTADLRADAAATAPAAPAAATSQPAQRRPEHASAEALPPVPQPNKKQPLGRKQVGLATLRWLGDGTRVCALEFVALVEQISSLDELREEAALLEAVAARFALDVLARRVNEVLTPPPAEVEANAELVSTHLPTVWSSFSSNVRTLLQARAAAAGDVDAWSDSLEWRLMGEMYTRSKEDKKFRWRLRPFRSEGGELSGTAARDDDADDDSDRPHGGGPGVASRRPRTQPGGSGAKEPGRQRQPGRRQAQFPTVGTGGATAYNMAQRAVSKAKEKAAAEQSERKRGAIKWGAGADAEVEATALAAQAADAPSMTERSAGPVWVQLDDGGAVKVLRKPVWRGDLSASPPPPLAIEGAAALRDTVEVFVTKMARLLRLERQAALAAAIAAVDDTDDTPEAGAQGADDGKDAAVRAVTGRTETESVAGGYKDTVGGKAAVAEDLEPGEQLGRRLSEVKLRNAMELDGGVLLTLTPRNASRLAECTFAEGDVVAVVRDKAATRAHGGGGGGGDSGVKRVSSASTSDSLLSDESEDGDDGVGGTQNAGVLLRGVVSRVSPFSIGIKLEFQEDEEEAWTRPGSADAGPDAAATDGVLGEGDAGRQGKITSSSSSQADSVPARRSALEPLRSSDVPQALLSARAMLGDPVRVIWLGSDLTHARNMQALAALVAIANEAVNGTRNPALGMVSAVFQGTHGAGQSTGDGSDGGSASGGGNAQVKEVVAGGAAGSADPRQSRVFDETLNPVQLRAVDSATSVKESLAVVHGPPGTGKTAVLVESVRQCVARGERLLLCAPANMAVDLLVLRLVAADSNLRIVRFGNPERIDVRALGLTPERVAARRAVELKDEAKAELSRLLADVGANDKMGATRKAQMRSFLKRHMRTVLAKRVARGEFEALASADVVLCTATGAADAAISQLPLFDRAFLDEASQATQPNAWLPFLRARRGVLLGDPQQLPPTVISQEAKREGLSVSLMEAALAAAPALSTMLTTQFRMHGSISEWASGAMYAERLVAHPTVKAHTLSELEGVRDTADTRAPIVAIEVPSPGGSGWERRDARGGVSNRAEADAAVAHVRALVRAGVNATDIAVISPYVAQVSLLSLLLRIASESPTDASLGGVCVATVDSFQGREAEAVVVSLVRSNAAGAVGFVADQRRLNVAVTRARRHLALVFDAHTVSKDAFLANLVAHATARGERRQAGPLAERAVTAAATTETAAATTETAAATDRSVAPGDVAGVVVTTEATLRTTQSGNRE